MNPDDCKCCTCWGHEFCKIILNPSRRTLIPNSINEIIIGPDYIDFDLVYELKDSQVQKRFKILNTHFYPDEKNMLRLFVVSSIPVILKPGEVLATLCLSHTEALVYGNYFFLSQHL